MSVSLLRIHAHSVEEVLCMVVCRRFINCLGLAAIAGLGVSASALADDVKVANPARATAGQRVTITAGTPVVNRGPGTLLYSAMGATPLVGNVRFNPGLGGPGGAGGTINDISVDDVPVLNAMTQPQLEIHSVSVGVRHAAADPSCDVRLIAYPLLGDGSTIELLNGACDVPGAVVLGTQAKPVGGAAFTTAVMTYTPATPVTLNLNNDLFPGFGAVGIGLQFDGPNGPNDGHGWLCRFPDAGFANAQQLFWVLDLVDQAAPDDEGAFQFGDPTVDAPPATFQIQLTGTIVGTGAPTGACCDTVTGDCALFSQIACEAFVDTTYQGDGTTCTPNVTCGVQGACCFGDGTCALLLAATCTADATNVYGGDTTVCTTANICPAVGSCCTGSCCEIRTDAGCAGAWTSGGSCASNPCGLPPNDTCAGATAVSVGANPGGSCNATTDFSITPETQCPTGAAGSGGSSDVWHTFVAPNTAQYIIDTCNAIGYDTVLAIYDAACGTIDANTIPLACNDDQPAPACGVQPFASQLTVSLNQGQSYLIRVAGFSTTGGPTGSYILTIAENATGACCVPGSASCFTDTSANCTSPGVGGTFLGANVSCTPEPCPGACCAPDGTCSIATAAACTNGSLFQGVNTLCAQVSCSIIATGACCNGSTCTSTTQVFCQGNGGTYQGDSTSCTPSPCAPATGACCCGSSCQITTVAACSGANRVFQGGGSVCTPFSLTVPCCRGNYNKSAPGPGAPGGVSVQDIFDFLTGYFSTDPCANTNDSAAGPGAPNGVSVQDIFDFLAAYFGGCI
ncbi:MAG: hypothetical protein IT438_07750 [Phycisphaerales bacterium]|nr:hypothetical protein [Phycisphaerales bacterium]